VGIARDLNLRLGPNSSNGLPFLTTTHSRLPTMHTKRSWRDPAAYPSEHIPRSRCGSSAFVGGWTI